MPSLPSGTALGPYVIESALGEGGMGEVYRARDTRLKRDVAVKVLPAQVTTDAERLQRFHTEAEAAAALNHPHICAVYDIGHHDQTWFIVMELLDGETLAARLARGPLPLEKAVDIGIAVADALTAAHQHGVIHRDVKPANIVLARSGLKLLDFGLAKLRPASPVSGFSVAATQLPLTGAGAVLGSLNYMAPEQVEGRDADARSDVFALGCVRYETLTGKRVFDAGSAASVMAAILERPARCRA